MSGPQGTRLSFHRLQQPFRNHGVAPVIRVHPVQQQVFRRLPQHVAIVVEPLIDIDQRHVQIRRESPDRLAILPVGQVEAPGVVHVVGRAAIEFEEGLRPAHGIGRHEDHVAVPFPQGLHEVTQVGGIGLPRDPGAVHAIPEIDAGIVEPELDDHQVGFVREHIRFEAGPRLVRVVSAYPGINDRPVYTAPHEVLLKDIGIDPERLAVHLARGRGGIAEGHKGEGFRKIGLARYGCAGTEQDGKYASQNH